MLLCCKCNNQLNCTKIFIKLSLADFDYRVHTIFDYFLWAARKYGGTFIKERNNFIDIHCPKGLLANLDTLESNRFILTSGCSLQPPFRSHTASDVFQNVAFAIKQLFSNLEQQSCNIKRDKSIYFGVTIVSVACL